LFYSLVGGVSDGIFSKWLEHQINQSIWGLPDGICRLYRGIPKIIKKNIEIPNQPIGTKKFPKSMFSTLKMERSQNFVLELVDGICRFYLKI
jgi:hypothetical protein